MLWVPLPAFFYVEVGSQRLPAFHDFVACILLRYFTHLFVFSALYHEEIWVLLYFVHVHWELRLNAHFVCVFVAFKGKSQFLSIAILYQVWLLQHLRLLLALNALGLNRILLCYNLLGLQVKRCDHAGLNRRFSRFWTEGNFVGQGIEGFGNFRQVYLYFRQQFDVLLQNLDWVVDPLFVAIHNGLIVSVFNIFNSVNVIANVLYYWCCVFYVLAQALSEKSGVCFSSGPFAENGVVGGVLLELDNILNLLVKGIDTFDEWSVFIFGFEQEIKNLIVFEIKLFEMVLEFPHKQIDLSLSIFCLGRRYRKRIVFFHIYPLNIEPLAGEDDGTFFAVKKHVIALAADELVSGCLLRVIDATIVTFGVRV